MHRSVSPFMESSFLNNHLVTPLERVQDEVWIRDLPIIGFKPYPLPKLNRQRFNQMCSVLRALGPERCATWHLYLAQSGPRWRTVIEPEIVRQEAALLSEVSPADVQQQTFTEPMLLIGCLKTVEATDRSVLIDMLPHGDGVFIAWQSTKLTATVVIQARGQIHFPALDRVLTDDGADPICLG